jgi:hypothetical protein
MHKWIAGSTCAAAVLSLAVASAQTYPQTSDTQPTTKSSSRSSSSTRTPPQRVTMTGCLTRGTGAQSSRWILSNATMADATTTAGVSRSGSPSNEGTTAANRNGTAAIGVSGSTSTGVGTSGTNIPTGAIDTEAHGGGTLGATDQKGGTVGAGATAGATTGTTGTDRSGSTSPSGRMSYQLMGVPSPTQYMNKRVEVVGTTSTPSSHMLRVSSVRVLGDTCQ